jgi:hypothetical protein
LFSFSTTFVFAMVPRHNDAHGHDHEVIFALGPSPTVPGAVAEKNLDLFNTADDTGKAKSGVVAARHGQGRGV